MNPQVAAASVLAEACNEQRSLIIFAAEKLRTIVCVRTISENSAWVDCAIPSFREPDSRVYKLQTVRSLFVGQLSNPGACGDRRHHSYSQPVGSRSLQMFPNFFPVPDHGGMSFLYFAWLGSC